MEPEQTDNGYALKQPRSSAAGAVRIGFLANSMNLVDETMQYYQNSDYFDDRFTKLKGMYKEPNTETDYRNSDRFLIYEPNCDFHPTDELLDGNYVETRPLTLVNGKIQAVRARNLTAQKKSIWKPA